MLCVKVGQLVNYQWPTRGDGQRAWIGRRSCDWSHERSYNQLGLISKRCANDFSRRADEYLKLRTITCRGRYRSKRLITFL